MIVNTQSPNDLSPLSPVSPLSEQFLSSYETVYGPQSPNDPLHTLRKQQEALRTQQQQLAELQRQLEDLPSDPDKDPIAVAQQAQIKVKLAEQEAVLTQLQAQLLNPRISSTNSETVNQQNFRPITHENLSSIPKQLNSQSIPFEQQGKSYPGSIRLTGPLLKEQHVEEFSKVIPPEEQAQLEAILADFTISPDTQASAPRPGITVSFRPSGELPMSKGIPGTSQELSLRSTPTADTRVLAEEVTQKTDDVPKNASGRGGQISDEPLIFQPSFVTCFEPIEGSDAASLSSQVKPALVESSNVIESATATIFQISMKEEQPNQSPLQQRSIDLTSTQLQPALPTFDRPSEERASASGQPKSAGEEATEAFFRATAQPSPALTGEVCCV